MPTGETRPTTPLPVKLERLRRAVGLEVEYEGARCLVVDVLDDPPVLVLRRLGESAAIQADSYGKAVRRAPALVEIPVVGGDGTVPSEELTRVRFPPSRATR